MIFPPQEAAVKIFAGMKENRPVNRCMIRSSMKMPVLNQYIWIKKG